MRNPIETIVAKGAGKVHAVQAMTKGLRGVFVTLAEQHQEAAVLLSRVTSTDDSEKRRDLWQEIRKQLVSHERAELAAIYPVLANDPRTKEVVRIHAEEAGQLEKLINQIDAIDPDSPQWHQQVQTLTHLIKEHAAEEEGDFFLRAQEVLGDEGARRLERSFDKAKEREMGSGH